MRPYSADLRERIVAAVDRHQHSLRQLARLFSVSLSFLVRLLHRRRHTGSTQPRPHAGGPRPCLGPKDIQRLLTLVRHQPDATLAELRDRLGIPCSLSTVARALSRQGFTRKKKSLHASERDSKRVQKLRRAFDQSMAEVDVNRLVFVDETGANTTMTRTYGRAPAGERVEGSAPGQWRNVTLIAGLRPTEVVAPFVFEGATDTAAFETYVQAELLPALRPGDVVVWDNLNAHKSREVVETVEGVGARVEPLPPWSADKAPIEEMFGKVKEYLRKVAARTTGAVMAAMGEALTSVTPQDILGWFQDRCAYAMH
jgi:transposase